MCSRCDIRTANVTMAVVATGFLVAQISQATEIHDFPIWGLATEYGYGTIRDLDAVG